MCTSRLAHNRRLCLPPFVLHTDAAVVLFGPQNMFAAQQRVLPGFCPSALVSRRGPAHTGKGSSCAPVINSINTN